MDSTLRLALVGMLVVANLGFWGNRNSEEKIDERRQKIETMHDEVLAMLAERAPAAPRQAKDAPGYAVFSNVGLNVVVASFAGGNGVVVDNRTGERTYMNMGSAGIGLGLGVKDFRAVFVFEDPQRLEDFIEHGWDFSGQADATVKSDDKGGGAEMAATAVPGVRIYQLTKTGLALQATLQGTKYWKSDRLNEK